MREANITEFSDLQIGLENLHRQHEQSRIRLRKVIITERDVRRDGDDVASEEDVVVNRISTLFADFNSPIYWKLAVNLGEKNYEYVLFGSPGILHIIREEDRENMRHYPEKFDLTVAVS